ncbi:hypothetical protein FE257_002900 [Aspergillus nanangensis]|uniref:Uncharacterized protein n=1 Tax=Aspergillus nanangensis TaxID=2582783 RepID=A0AAD4CT02_ASPNN|nr:hypothetical protein FE257_002900 [Aspergillus nanangensis]
MHSMLRVSHRVMDQEEEKPNSQTDCGGKASNDAMSVVVIETRLMNQTTIKRSTTDDCVGIFKGQAMCLAMKQGLFPDSVYFPHQFATIMGGFCPTPVTGSRRILAAS